MARFQRVVVKPNIDISPGTAFSDNDLLFDWTAFETQSGVGKLTSVSAVIAGTNGSAGNAHDFTLYFAKSDNGVAPTSLGTVNSAVSAYSGTSVKNQIIASRTIDNSAFTDGGHLLEHTVLGNAIANYAWLNFPVFSEDATYSGTSAHRNKTYWVAAVAHGAFDFGSDVQLNQVSHQAARTEEVQITVEQGGGGAGDPRKTFAKGDLVIGATGGPTMEVVSVDGASAMTVKGISEQIDNNEELVLRQPIHLTLGFQF
tara:strand:+ start:41 stop:811 length:771 start_codon:yes stop_codon:yes gene_type:complete